MSLNFAPSTGTVQFSVSTNDTTEGVITSPSTIQFDTTNWNYPQTILVQGVDDNIVDGNITYSVIIDLLPQGSGDSTVTNLNLIS